MRNGTLPFCDPSTFEACDATLLKDGIMVDLIRQAARDIRSGAHVIALTGAGMSTESGIPDFRGPQGIWTRDKEAESRAYQRYELFLSDPGAYWDEVSGRQGTHGAFYTDVRKAEPNPGHFALAALEAAGHVRCVITQNSDGLHRKAGSRTVVEYHGSVHRLRCLSCGFRQALDDVANGVLPPKCRCGRAFKLDVVHFGEEIPPDVMEAAESQALECDVMLVCGTSAVVYPFARLPRLTKARGTGVTVIEVNSEPTVLTAEGVSDYPIRGKTGEVLPQIAEELRRINAG